MDTSAYVGTAEAAWRWLLDQVRDDDGPWLPTSVPVDSAGDRVPADVQPGPFRDGMHEGIGSLAHVLAEIRATRPWTEEESALADGIGERLRGRLATTTDATYFDGLPSDIGVLLALGQEGAGKAVGRLLELATPDGWAQSAVGAPRYSDDARLNDLTSGTAGVLLAAVWAARHHVPGAGELASDAAGVLLGEAEPTLTGLTWLYVPRRFHLDHRPEMPNFSHGLAGIAAALAVAGAELGRPDLVDVARSGAEHLVSLADTGGGGFVVPKLVPPAADTDADEATYTWCHGPTGTSLLFSALATAGVEGVAGAPPSSWHRRCLHSVRASGLPARLYPGFWDNDGQCCGTAGAGDVFLHAYQRSGNEQDLVFALQLADTIVERAFRRGPHAYWRFVEHRAPEPLLPPGTGLMQGAAGIALFLFRAARVAVQGAAAQSVARMDTWFALPGSSSSVSTSASQDHDVSSVSTPAPRSRSTQTAMSASDQASS